MQRLLLITISLLYSCCALAKPGYQIDLILFAQQPAQNTELTVDAPLIPSSFKAITLRTSAGKETKPYCLLPNSYSSLKDQYYLLSRKSHYPVLGHYSWQQPANNQSSVALPFVEHNGWQMQGTFRISQSAYYSFKADLQVSPPNNPQSSFSVSHQQRLKANEVYYLDHEQLGMLVKIHPLA